MESDTMIKARGNNAVNNVNNARATVRIGPAAYKGVLS